MDSWQPHPHSLTPINVPRRLQKGIFVTRRSWHDGGHARGACCGLAGKGKLLTKAFQGCLSLILLVTIFINMTFIIEKTRHIASVTPTADSSSSLVALTGMSRRNNLRLQESTPRSITLEVVSSQTRVAVNVDGATIVEANEERTERGIHVLVLHQSTGAVMAQRVFDTYSPHEDDALGLFLSMVSQGRIIVLAIKDEGTFQMKKGLRDIIRRLGSTKVGGLTWRDMWAFVGVKGGHVYGEQVSKSKEFNSWGVPVVLRVEVPLVAAKESECKWPESEESERRRQFCNHIEGYGSVCACEEPAPLVFTNEPLLNNRIHDIPVSIIASNRPHYLYRSLRSLLASPGVNPEMITVFIDGYYEEPLAVAKLFGLRGIQHTPLGVKNARITAHYKASLTATFNIFPNAKYVIILEEDLDVAPDFFSYFSQTLRLLEEDPSIFCVSAWNDQGYEHTSADPRRLYRVETMPGLGWILKKQLYKDELESWWPTPEKMWDWDMWIRLPDNMKQRECIVPDVSRTYHFGSSGINMNSFFQDSYFKKHSLNTLPYVELKDIDSLKKSAYEDLLNGMLKEAVVLDHSKSPCDENFVPDSLRGNPAMFFIKMEGPKDFTTWLQVAKCLGIWDLDARGYHKGMWRFHLKKNPVFVIGVPQSKYSHFKPKNISPIIMEAEKKNEIDNKEKKSEIIEKNKHKERVRSRRRRMTIQRR